MRPWSIEECEAYAKQLRDKNRACTAEHAAQAIEYLLELPRREWVGLTDAEIQDEGRHHEKSNRNGDEWFDRLGFARAIEARLKEKNQ